MVEGTFYRRRVVGWCSLSSKREGNRILGGFLAINFDAFMQRRFSRINEKGKRGRNMDRLSHFKHVATVALVTFQLILKREKGSDTRDGRGEKRAEDHRGEKGSESRARNSVSAGASVSYLLSK